MNSKYLQGITHCINTIQSVGRRIILPPEPDPTFHTRCAGESILLMLDKSGSMTGQCGRCSKSKAAGRASIAMLDQRLAMGAHDDIAIIEFDFTAHQLLPFTPIDTHYAKIKRAIKSIRACGGTNMNAAFELALPLVSTASKRPIHIVMLTDGHGGDPRAIATEMKKNGVIIETIGVGDVPQRVDEPLLKEVASTLNGKVLYRFIRDSGDLIEYFRTEVAGRLVR